MCYLHSTKNVDRNEMEIGFKKGMLKFKLTSFNRKEKLKNARL